MICTSSRIALGLLLALPARVDAQLAHFTLSLSWSEVYAGTTNPVLNPNGVVDPGESALIALSIAFTPPVGSPVNYQSPTSGVGINAGFAHALFRMNAVQPVGGTWSNLQVLAGLAGNLGITQPDGGLVFCDIGQSSPPAVTANPLINVWGAVWTPGGFAAPYSAGFATTTGIDSSAPSLYAATGSTPDFGLAFGPVDLSLGHVSIPVAPAPSAMLLLPIFLRRRTRLG